MPLAIQNISEKHTKFLNRQEAAQLNDLLKRDSYFSGQCHSNAYPSVFNLETTNRCFFKCSHCPRPYIMKRPLRDMDIDLFKSILDQVEPFAQSVFFADRFEPVLPFVHYGEPTLYRHYAETIRLTREKGISTLISSTSSAMNDELIAATVNAGVDYLWLIFDGMDNETFKKIRGKAADFDKGIRNLEQLIQHKKKRGGQRLDINVVMIKHPQNRHQWDEFKSYFGSVAPVSTILAHFSTFAGNVSQICSLHSALQDDAEEQKEWARVSRLNKETCYYPWFSVSVLSNGKVVPCCRDINGDYELGDLNKTRLVDIWNGDRIKHLRKEFLHGNRDNPLCRNCMEGSLEIGLPQPLKQSEEEMMAKMIPAPFGLGH